MMSAQNIAAAAAPARMLPRQATRSAARSSTRAHLPLYFGGFFPALVTVGNRQIWQKELMSDDEASKNSLQKHPGASQNWSNFKWPKK
jgi:hypothetical protein